MHGVRVAAGGRRRVQVLGMSGLLDVTVVSGMGIGEARALVELGPVNGRLEVNVSHQTDRFRRVSLVWQQPGGQIRDRIFLGYLDKRTGEVIGPEEVAKRTPERMHAHTLHGTDAGRMMRGEPV